MWCLDSETLPNTSRTSMNCTKTTSSSFAIFHILLDRITHFVPNISRTHQILAKSKTSMIDMQGNDFKQQLEITAKLFFVQVVEMG